MKMLSYIISRQTGKALSFITREDWRSARELCVILQEASQVHIICILGYKHVIVDYLGCTR